MTQRPSSVCAPTLSRRSLLQALGVAFAAAPLAQVLGCSSAATPTGDAGADALSGADAVTRTDAAVAADTAVATDAVVATDTAVAADAAGGWITGGTSALGTVFPDPFTAPSGSTCALICQTTIGPCHTLSPLRSDVSDALDGIPMRLALRILDEACAPIPNAIVEIWHTNQLGIYSGNINTMCNSAAEDRAAMYFRGYQRTDANGRVDFNTCFPGWYRGRAVHIHLRVMTGEYNAADNAAASVITQLVFSDDLVREVFSQVPLYAAHGQPDTTNATDNVVGGIADRAPYIADVQRLPNGAMLASKTFIVKNATSTSTVCTAGR